MSAPLKIRIDGANVERGVPKAERDEDGEHELAFTMALAPKWCDCEKCGGTGQSHRYRGSDGKVRERPGKEPGECGCVLGGYPGKRRATAQDSMEGRRMYDSPVG